MIKSIILEDKNPISMTFENGKTSVDDNRVQWIVYTDSVYSPAEVIGFLSEDNNCLSPQRARSFGPIGTKCPRTVIDTGNKEYDFYLSCVELVRDSYDNKVWNVTTIWKPK